ncbi:hypothetical protein GCM10009801_18920 [Streptomyces albiaxialis]|uniref:Uncharacterized protein n=1 Tax=Streptomyces albiaxialis TaxID=329523 RepID=A0ABP5HCC4_9ACTN
MGGALQHQRSAVPVGDEVVHPAVVEVAVGRQREEPVREDRVVWQVDRGPGVLPHPRVRDGLRVGFAGEVDRRDRPPGGGGKELYGLSVPGLEAGVEGLGLPCRLREGVLEEAGVECAVELDAVRQVVGRGILRDLVRDPDLGLGGRQRIRLGGPGGHEVSLFRWVRGGEVVGWRERRRERRRRASQGRWETR